MAEFKTAEQYVVDRLETIEREYDNAKIQHAMEVDKLMNRLNSVEVELQETCQFLNMLRDFIRVREVKSGICVDTDYIFRSEHPELVARILEYYDLGHSEDE